MQTKHSTELLRSVLRPRDLDPAEAYVLRRYYYLEPTNPEHSRIIEEAAAQVRAAYYKGKEGKRFSGEEFHNNIAETNLIPFRFLKDIEDDNELAVAMTIFQRAGFVWHNRLMPIDAEAREEMYRITRNAAWHLAGGLLGFEHSLLATATRSKAY